MSDLVTRVGVIEDWRREYVDPKCRKIDDIELSHVSIQTKMNLLTAIAAATLTLTIGLIVALFAWGLNQVHLKVETNSNITQSNVSIPNLGR